MTVELALPEVIIEAHPDSDAVPLFPFCPAATADNKKEKAPPGGSSGGSGGGGGGGESGGKERRFCRRHWGLAEGDIVYAAAVETRLSMSSGELASAEGDGKGYDVAFQVNAAPAGHDATNAAADDDDDDDGADGAGRRCDPWSLTPEFEAQSEAGLAAALSSLYALCNHLQPGPGKQRKLRRRRFEAFFRVSLVKYLVS